MLTPWGFSGLRDRTEGVRRLVATALAALFLNAILGFVAIWPTVWVKPVWAIAPEFVGLAAFVCASWALGWLPSRKLVMGLTVFYVFMVSGHYADVVVPHIFGRPINLYWDVPQVPRFVWVTVQGVPWWATVGAVLGGLLAFWLLFKSVLWSIATLADGMAPVAKHWSTWGVLLALVWVIAPHYSKEPPYVNYVSKAVLPVYWKEANLLYNAMNPERAERLLPESTVIESALNSLDEPSGQALSALQGRDVMLMFLESYGAMLYDRPEARAGILETRKGWEQAIEKSGRKVVSAFYTSPTFGGASDLAHMSLLSGIELPLQDSQRHDLLLTTGRPTLLDVFQKANYEVFGLYHSVGWDWAERAYYGFDVYLSGLDLDYQGPAFGYWKIPDQYAAAKVEALHPRTPEAPPRLTLFPTISTHFPFYQVPPYQPDWDRLLGPNPFDADDVTRAQSEQVSWGNMLPDFIRTVNYSHQWLAGYFSLPVPRESLYVVIGDHQPTGNVAGENATWDVPVFVISEDDQLLDRFRALGFSDGMDPAQRESKGGLHDLTAVLLKALQ